MQAYFLIFQVEDSYFEHVAEKFSVQNIPYYDVLLNLTLQTPNKFRAEWLIRRNYKTKLQQKYGKDFLDRSEPLLRIFHLNAMPQPYVEDKKINIEKNFLEVEFSAPGETINTQLGLLTKNGEFIVLAQSNDLKVPKAN